MNFYSLLNRSSIYIAKIVYRITMPIMIIFELISNIFRKMSLLIFCVYLIVFPSHIFDFYMLILLQFYQFGV